MRNVLEAFRRNFYWQILCTPGLFYGKFKSVIISKSRIYTFVLGKFYCFRLLVAQSRQAATLTSLLQGNNVCARSCNVLAKQERTGLRRRLKGNKKCKEKYYWNTYAISAVNLDKKRGTITFGSIAKVNFEELFHKGRFWETFSVVIFHRTTTSFFDITNGSNVIYFVRVLS
jgi:hypothetical protein